MDSEQNIERLWRSIKYECVYLHAFGDFRDAGRHIGVWMNYYNDDRPHSSLDDLCFRAADHRGRKLVRGADRPRAAALKSVVKAH